jgi:hypothetical protein
MIVGAAMLTATVAHIAISVLMDIVGLIQWLMMAQGRSGPHRSDTIVKLPWRVA